MGRGLGVFGRFVLSNSRSLSDTAITIKSSEVASTTTTASRSKTSPILCITEANDGVDSLDESISMFGHLDHVKAFGG